MRISTRTSGGRPREQLAVCGDVLLDRLRGLTRNSNPRPLTRVLDFAQRYTAQIDFSSMESARTELTATNAFVDPNEALSRGIRLMLPSALGPA